MAGVGFRLRRILREPSYFNIFRAYSYAGILSAGPWVISILGIVLLGLIKHLVTGSVLFISQFQVSLAYLISASLILVGLAQHCFTRYISDCLFRKRYQYVTPQFMSMLLVMSGLALVIALCVVPILFPKENLGYQVLMVCCFVVLTNIWLASSLLSGLRSYLSILAVFAVGYGITAVLGYALYPLGLNGLMLGFFIGQSVLLLGELLIICREYPSQSLMGFDQFKPGRVYLSLVGVSFFYNIGVWADKYLFWINPSTSHPVIGLLRASVIYDMPMFLAMITMIPGMAVFLFRIETDFVEHYEAYYQAIREGGTLSEILRKHTGLVSAAQQGLLDIAKVQVVIVLLVFLVGPDLIRWFGISKLYLHLFKIDVISASLLVLFMGMLNLLFYLDKRQQALWLCVLFLCANVLFTLLSFQLGVFYFGYGYLVALLISTFATMLLLNYDFNRLNVTTFMTPA